MSEKYKVGEERIGKVTGIQPYGAFVALDETTQGLVHISEITHGYVKDIRDYLTIGENVKVKILSIDEQSGKISLSIKALEKAPEQIETKPRPKKVRKQNPQVIDSQPENESDPSGFNTLRDKLEEWIRQSTVQENLIKK
ncbi:S1 domain-containing post-transcriptional regulator GSP13 [Calidifontibacillus erzurumensis]|uniref:General stress protein 13 n=1 Tax=Calidifontibacillus erzurumensis TaxID=2741433 RepID=A0A8J8KBI3_9BACI|nr:S1 domain-containing post-transcriptional regulator GSP13 [Calidifontibacillus erzurumensis]NSL51652.1 general stress protein 13 [Calidifontibacillus erzurumensis]